MLGSVGLSVGDIQVAVEIWSLEKRTILMAQMGKHQEGDRTMSRGHGCHPHEPSMTWR